MGELRTTDTTYGHEYWQTLDGGAGYKDSLLWADICHDLWEVFVPDRTTGEDTSGQHSVLDVGCAYGFLIRHFRSRGVECFGVDFSEYALDNAPDDVRPHLRLHDLRTGNDTFFGPAKFSLVVSFETLEHITEEHVPNALHTIVRAAKPGGWIAMTICTDDQSGWETDPTHVTIKPRKFWMDHLLSQGLVHDPEKENELRRFWLFANHRGVFVFRKPS